MLTARSAGAGGGAGAGDRGGGGGDGPVPAGVPGAAAAADGAGGGDRRVPVRGAGGGRGGRGAGLSPGLSLAGRCWRAKSCAWAAWPRRDGTPGPAAGPRARAPDFCASGSPEPPLARAPGPLPLDARAVGPPDPLDPSGLLEPRSFLSPCAMAPPARTPGTPGYPGSPDPRPGRPRPPRRAAPTGPHTLTSLSGAAAGLGSRPRPVQKHLNKAPWHYPEPARLWWWGSIPRPGPARGHPAALSGSAAEPWRGVAPWEPGCWGHFPAAWPQPLAPGLGTPRGCRVGHNVGARPWTRGGGACAPLGAEPPQCWGVVLVPPHRPCPALEPVLLGSGRDPAPWNVGMGCCPPPPPQGMPPWCMAARPWWGAAPGAGDVAPLQPPERKQIWRGWVMRHRGVQGTHVP